MIVFRGSSNDESIWKKESFSNPLVFKLSKISNSEFEEICGYNAQEKYMALLCVGIDKELHSEYIPNLYDEYSVYVWYDYLSDVAPNVKDLEQCGFLPFVELQEHRGRFYVLTHKAHKGTVLWHTRGRFSCVDKNPNEGGWQMPTALFHLANNTKICYTYDTLSRVTSRTVKNACDGIISTENYTYDAVTHRTVPCVLVNRLQIFRILISYNETSA